MKITRFLLTLALLSTCAASIPAAPLGSAFTYQGRLTHAESPASGQYEFQFSLYDAVTNGNLVGLPVNLAPVSVSNGLFQMSLDFGANVFTGAERWLEITVTVFNSDMVPVTLKPRQRVSPTPYALHAMNAEGLTRADAGPLDFTANGQRMLRLEPTPPNDAYAEGAPNVIGGSESNFVAAGVAGATIAGGGVAHDEDGFPFPNRVTGVFGTVGGGFGNTSGWWATVAGGSINSATGPHSTVAGGSGNNSSGTFATVSGGLENTSSGYGASVGGGAANVSRADDATVGGGRSNTNSGSGATVAGGVFNLCSNPGATVSGGTGNTSSGWGATVGGGGLNLSSGYAASVGGGDHNIGSGDNATVAGGRANASAGEGASVGGGANNLSTGGYGTIGGGLSNTNEAFAGTVAGGTRNMSLGMFSTVSGGRDNVSQGDDSTVAGGVGNLSSGEYSTVGGGQGNISAASEATTAGGALNSVTSWAATIGGGYQNANNGNCATIAGGFVNRIQTNANFATIAGGERNSALTNYATVGGGGFNSARGFAATVGGGGGYVDEAEGNGAAGDWSTVSGGKANWTSADFGVVGGGENNSAEGRFAVVPGGMANRAQGEFSFAAGENTHAMHDGTFVWADASFGGILRSTTNNQFTARASGGVRFFSDSAATAGVELAAGGNAWSVLSDRNAKEHFAPLDCREVLDKLNALPVTAWNLKSQPAAVRHIGPMAQDFHAAFGVGEDDRHISTSDADGVALAAIKGLNQKLEEQLQRRDAENAELKLRLAKLEQIVRQLTTKEGMP